MNNVVRVENSKYLTGQGGSSGSGGHTIQNDSGTALPQESALQFVGVYSEDDSTNGKTKVNIIREMTKAQMDALSTDAKKGVIHTTDEADNPANPVSTEVGTVNFSEGVNVFGYSCVKRNGIATLIVELNGNAFPTKTPTTIGTIEEGFRPYGHRLLIVGYVDSGSLSYVDAAIAEISTDGTIRLSPNVNGFISFSTSYVTDIL